MSQESRLDSSLSIMCLYWIQLNTEKLNHCSLFVFDILLDWQSSRIFMLYYIIYIWLCQQVWFAEANYFICVWQGRKPCIYFYFGVNKWVCCAYLTLQCKLVDCCWCEPADLIAGKYEPWSTVKGCLATDIPCGLQGHIRMLHSELKMR